MSCRPGSHAFAPVVQNGIAVIFCPACGEVRDLAPRVEVAPQYRYDGPLTSDSVPPLPPQVAKPEELERSVQELEADVVERLRDGLGHESWSSIMQRAGIDPASDFARSLGAKVGAQQAAFEEQPSLGFRQSVTGLPPEEAALIEESNRHEQRRIVVDDSALAAGL